MAAGEAVGGMDGGVAGLAEEGVVGGAEPAGPLPQAAVAGPRGLAADGVHRRNLLAYHVCVAAREVLSKLTLALKLVIHMKERKKTRVTKLPKWYVIEYMCD